MLFLDYLFRRILWFIFHFDLGITYFFKRTLYRNLIKFIIYLSTKNKLVKLYHNLNIVDEIRWSSMFGLPLFLYYYFIELMRNFYIFYKKHKTNFLIKLQLEPIKAPALEIYYPLKTSIFSVTLRITGVFATLGFGLFVWIVY